MPEKSLYFTKALQCKWLKSLAIYWIKVRELWVVYERVLRHFSVFPRIHAPILPDKLQKNYKTFSMWLQNKDKTETYNALCNFSESPHMCKLPNYMAWCIMQLVHFAPYIWLAACTCLRGSLGCLCGLGLYGH